MSSAYYSDRVRGPRARSEEEIDETLWEAIQALVERSVDTAVFAEDFPVGCEDGKGVYACDRQGIVATVRAEVPDLGYHFYERGLPPTLAILDFLELMYRHASEPSERDFHSYFKHRHLRFDRAAGRRALRENANRLLARSGSVYELDEHGRIHRPVPSPVHQLLALELPPTGDPRLRSPARHLGPQAPRSRPGRARRSAREVVGCLRTHQDDPRPGQAQRRGPAFRVHTRSDHLQTGTSGQTRRQFMPSLGDQGFRAVSR
jgi:hypothetical protein